MSDRFVVCTGCRRHVRAREIACPFCALRRGAAAAVIGLAASACGGGDASGPAVVAPTMEAPDAASASVSAPASASPPASAPAAETKAPAAAPSPPKRGTGMPAAVYGGPPPR